MPDRSLGPEFDTRELAAFRRDVRRLDPLVDREVRDAAKDAADKVAVTAGALAPRLSGALAHSIRPFVSGGRVSVGSTLPYAGVQEWGGTISPRGAPISIRGAHMVTRAAEDHEAEFREELGDAIDRAAHRVGLDVRGT